MLSSAMPTRMEWWRPSENMIPGYVVIVPDSENVNSTIQEENLSKKRALIPNGKALLALIPASALLALAIAANERHGNDYDMAVPVWGLSGFTIAALAFYMVRDDTSRTEGSTWSTFVLIWSGLVAVICIAMIAAWANLEYHFSKALFFTMMTSALWVFGFVFILWKRLQGNTGMLGKWLSISLGIPFLAYAVFWAFELLYDYGIA